MPLFSSPSPTQLGKHRISPGPAPRGEDEMKQITERISAYRKGGERAQLEAWAMRKPRQAGWEGAGWGNFSVSLGPVSLEMRTAPWRLDAVINCWRTWQKQFQWNDEGKRSTGFQRKWEEKKMETVHSYNFFQVLLHENGDMCDN